MTSLTRLFGLVVYFAFASLSYAFIFDHASFTHPKYLKNQVRLEIWQSVKSLPGMAILTAPLFLAEVRGYAKLYDSPSDAPFVLYNYLQVPFFILFTDCFVYWIHRGLHHPKLYKTLHKSHHKWIMPTPFASHAFHPVDGFAQSVPYHVFPFIFPLQKFAYIVLFVFINIWTILIRMLLSLTASYARPSSPLTSRCRRWRVRGKFSHSQRCRLPHYASFVFQLQLRSVHNPLGSRRGLVPSTKSGAVLEGVENE